MRVPRYIVAHLDHGGATVAPIQILRSGVLPPDISAPKEAAGRFESIPRCRFVEIIKCS